MPRSRRDALARALHTALATMSVDYEAGLRQSGKPRGTVRAYTAQVRQYLAWLAETLAAGNVSGDPLTNAGARDRAVRDYRAHLLTVAQLAPSTVNCHLTAIRDFYRHRGLGLADAKCEDRPTAASSVTSPAPARPRHPAAW